MKKCVFVLMLCLVITSKAFAMTLTFEGVIEGQVINFSVSGDVGGVNNIMSYSPPGQTLWAQDWQISSISNWALLPSPVPSTYANNGYAVGQMLYGAPYAATNWGFRYREGLTGNNYSTLETWGHEIIIDTETPFNTMSDLLGITGAFNYSETSAYATNYTSDGSTEANFTRLRKNGVLTLVALDDSYTPVPPPPPTQPVPEPATMLLLSLGLAGVAIARKKFQK